MKKRLKIFLKELLTDYRHVKGRCNICGKETKFYYTDKAMWRESLNCKHCLATSRYRSIARGVLLAVEDLNNLKVSSLSALAKQPIKKLNVYDTQPSFSADLRAYPIPDLLKANKKIDVKISMFKPDKKLGIELAKGITNQNLQNLTFADASLDLVITSDIMEHVRLDDLAHKEIYRVLKPGGIYIFTVPHTRTFNKNIVRCQVTDPKDPSKDVHLLEPEYHGDLNSNDGKGVLSYRVYGLEIDDYLTKLGFTVHYSHDDLPTSGIMNTELFYCIK